MSSLFGAAKTNVKNVIAAKNRLRSRILEKDAMEKAVALNQYNTKETLLRQINPPCCNVYVIISFFATMKLLRLLPFVFSLMFTVFSLKIHATHYRAGEITYRVIGNFRIEARVVTYSKTSSIPADRPEITISWGDGDTSVLPRSNGPLNGGVYQGEELANDIKKNVYIGTHTYPGTGGNNRFFIISFYDQNRIAGINNIQNGQSVNIPFYVEDTVKFPTDLANIGFNSSPILLNDPIDFANLGDTFYHNPAAYDPDGDSLVFELMPCLQEQGVSVLLYAYPDLYCRNLNQPNNLMQLNRRTGELIWATPCQVGIFNIAILIHEYRAGINVGTMIRDMQIIVLSENNEPPQIADVRDTCIRAGDLLTTAVRATDPQLLQRVTLSASGGPFFVATDSARFTQNLPVSNPATGIFRWQTNCSHIQKQDYIVVFKAEDNYTSSGTPAPLVDIETWLIRVIAPPPTGLTANATNQQVTLNWDNPYECASSPDFRGFSVWRKTGCDPFTPDYCETGLATRGYTKLTTANIFTYTYTDNTTVPGQQYSYRIVAHFSKLSPNGLFQFNPTESVPSNEVCLFMPISVPVILNVDVTQTDVINGQIWVRWTKPRAGGNNLDTIQNPPPYRFDVYRSPGFDLTAPILVLSTPDATSFSALTDTTFTDNGINTTDGAWSYKILFYSNNDTVGATAAASSVYLNVQSSDQSLFLSWSENVPWTNDSFEVFKYNKVTTLFDVIDTVYTHNYTDTGLINDSTYCYFVRAYGHYTLDSFPKPLINNSQEDCGIPIDTVAPCPPTLFVRNDCDQYTDAPWNDPAYINYLNWSVQNDACSEDITQYRIYYGNDSSSMTLLATIDTKGDTSFNHILQESLAGCYAITALDRIGNESAYSNVFCVDNCPYYMLPNTFTPNGDGKNDLFHPYRPYRFVPKIEMKIFNRWGEMVFETTDPEINWDGKDLKGRELNEAVYLYTGYYYEQRQSGLVRRPLSGEKKGGGFIHLIRGK